LDPPKITDEFVDQLESVIVQILDELASIRTGSRTHGRKCVRWLPKEAIGAKRPMRRLERCWKFTGAEADRMTYRTACRDANTLTNSSRNQHRYQRIFYLKGDSRRVWSAVKDLLHGEAVCDGRQKS
jgi:hypothetical protein